MPRALALLLLTALSGCALPWAHTRRNLHFARYRLMSGNWKMECGGEGEQSFCLFRTKNPAEEDPKATIFFLQYATGDAKSLARLGLANAIYRSYRKARLPVPRLLSVSYGSHWLFSNQPGRRQVIATDRFFDEALPSLEKKLGSTPDRYLWGMSQGGYNVLQLAIARPALWKAAAVSCPALYAVDPFTADAAAAAARTGAPKSWVVDGMALFNTRLQDSAAWSAEEPIGRVRAGAALPPLLIQANLSDEFGFLEGAHALADALKTRGADVRLQDEKGSHCVNDVAKVAVFFQSKP